MIDLKPCPFCGGRAERIDLDEDETDPNYGGSFIYCPDCLASSKLIFGEKVGLEEAWNNRKAAPSAKPGAIREALQNIADQGIRDEMDEDTVEDADWEAGYEALIKIARTALEKE